MHLMQRAFSQMQRPGAMPSDATTRARIVGEICAHICAGQSVASIFGDDFKRPDDWPSEPTFWRWIDDPELEKLYDRATMRRAEKYAEEVVSIVDEEPRMVQTQFGEHVDQGHVAWQKNRAEKRQWVAARMRPKRWGDKMLVGSDPDNPIPPLVVIGAAGAKTEGDGGTGTD